MHQLARQTMTVDSNQILDDLTSRQFIYPHSPVATALSQSSAALGFCPRAANHAMDRLEINPDQSIGRLRRTELTQLARSIYRFWKHAAAIPAQSSAE
jgi:hypothetical protein